MAGDLRLHGAVRAILAEWTQATSIDDRINHLENGGGLNDPHLLDGSVIADALLDILEGGLDADWFIVFPADSIAAGEPTVDDRVNNE